MAFKKYNEESQNKLIALLDKISFNLMCPENIESYSEEIRKIYENSALPGDAGNFRHAYSQLSKYVIEKYQSYHTEEIVTILTNLREIIEYVDKTESENAEYKSSIFKLYDHINMEFYRCQFYIDTSNKAQLVAEDLNRAANRANELFSDSDYMENVQTLKKNLDKANQEARKANREAKSLQTQVISVLGIFSAVVLVFFGGFSYATSIFDNLHKLDFVEAVFFMCGIGFVLFNTTAFLMIIISYLIEKPLNFKDETPKNGFKTIYKVTNLVLILIIGVYSLIYICSR